MPPIPHGKKTISREDLVSRLKALGETTVAAKGAFHGLEPDWKPETPGSTGRWPARGYRRLQNAWLTRNEGERRLVRMLLVGGYFHVLVSFLLYDGLVARFPAEVLPLWMRRQPVVGFAFGLLLAAGGVVTLFRARNCLQSARSFLALYFMLLLLNGAWLLCRSGHFFESMYPGAAGFLIFCTLGTVCHVGGRDFRRGWKGGMS